MSGSHLSKEFFDLVKSIGESRSKQEEDKIIVNEVATLKAKMGARDVPARKMKEYLIRMLYVEMLGHDASFGHIHGIKMAHSRALLEKRVGYLAVSLTLHKDHSFLLLLINTLQTDLKSDNFLEASMALTVTAKLVNSETIPAMLPLVVKLLEHKEGSVKKKAVMCLHRFHQLDPASIATLGGPIRKALCDSNISVMAASLNLFLDLCAQKPGAYKDLVPDFVSILKQVIEHRLPRDYDYHRCPAPWVQLKLLQILAVLGVADKNASEGMYEILREVLKRADIGINVGYAIVYECVRTITSIYPDPALIEEAAASISRFITADNHNLKYLGVNALAAIVQIDSKYAAEHQLVVIDCLEDPDETLKRKTLDLLYSMTNPANVTVIVAKLTQFLQGTSDAYLRSELVSRINQLAEKYAPSNQWFIATMNNVFELSANTSVAVSSSMSLQTAGLGGGTATVASSSGVGPVGGVSSSEKLIKTEMANSILRLISENAQELQNNYPGGQVPAGEEDIRVFAADTYAALLTSRRNKQGYSNTLPDILLQVCAWVLGEYGHLSSTMSPSEVLQLLVGLLERQVDSPAVTKSWILAAVVKMAAKLAALGMALPANVVDSVAKYENSLFVDLQQRAFEFRELIQAPQTLTACLPLQNQFDLDIALDENLSFLDGYVATALANGAKPYNADPAAKARVAAGDADPYGAVPAGGKALKFQPYQAPEREIAPPVAHHAPAASHSNNGLFEQYATGSAAAAPAPQQAPDSELRLNNVARRWGPAGYNDPESASTTAAASAAPAHAAPHAAAARPTMAAMPSPAQLAEQAANARAEEERQAREREKERKARELASRPREPTEKEKAAMALFAGVGGAAAPAPAARRPVQASPVAAAVRPAQPVTATPVRPVAAAPDLFGGLMEAPVAQPVAQAKPVAAASSDSLDFLMGGSSAPAAAPAPAASPAKPAAASNDLFDLFGGGASAAPVAAAPAASNAGDLFGSFGAAAPAPAASNGASSGGFDMFSQLGAGSASYGQAGASSEVSQQISALKSPSAEEIVVADSRVQVSLVKGSSASAAVVAFFVSNKTGAPLENVQVNFNLPLGMAVAWSGDAGVQTPGGSSPAQHVLLVPSLPPHRTAAKVASLVVRDLAAFNSATHGALAVASGSVLFSGLASPLAFTSELAPSLFLRPAAIDPKVLGAAWAGLPAEVKGRAQPTTCSSSAQFMQRMSAALNVAAVQVIGAENMCAARLALAPPAPGVAAAAPHADVVVYGKVLPTHVEITVKAKARELAGAIAKQVAAALR